jgi:hypothetical protein
MKEEKEELRGLDKNEPGKEAPAYGGDNPVDENSLQIRTKLFKPDNSIDCCERQQ